MIMGIDFGTSYSSVTVKDGSNIISLENDLLYDEKSLGIPTVFMNTEDGPVFGDAWKDRVKDYRDVVFNVKTLIRSSPEGFEKTVVSGNKIFRLREIAKQFLDYLIKLTLKRVKAYNLEAPYLEAITITSPIGIDDNLRSEEYNRVLREVLREIVTEILPGFDSSRIYIIEEPLAGAFSNLKSVSRRNQSEKLLVFDLGGGTLDLALVSHVAGEVDSYEVLATGGDLHLGGNDWDESLALAVTSKLNIPTDRNSKESFEFNSEITQTKIQLSSKDEVFFSYSDRFGKEYSDEITLDMFNKCSKPLIEKAIALVQNLLIESNLTPNDIDRISLVGGSSRMRQVYDEIAKIFPHLDNGRIEHFDKSNAISLGAAMYAEMKIQKELTGWKDILHHSYGIDLKPRSDSEFEILYLMFKGEYIWDGVKSATLKVGIHPEADGNRYVFFSVYESNVDKSSVDEYGFYKMSKYERPTGLAVRINVPLEYRGRATEYTIYPTLSIDSNGILGIELKDEQGNILVSKTKNMKKRIIDF